MADAEVDLNIIEMYLQVPYKYGDDVILDFEPTLPVQFYTEVLSVTINSGSSYTFVTLGKQLSLEILSPFVVVQGPIISSNVVSRSNLNKSHIENLTLNLSQEYIDKNLLPIHLELKTIAGDLGNLSEGKKQEWESGVLSSRKIGTTVKKLIRHSLYNYSSTSNPTLRSKTKL